MSTRAAPMQPRGRILGSLQRAPLRQIVIIMTLCGIAWGMAFGIQSFEDLSFDRSQASDLTTFDIIIGSMFMGFAAIEIFGLVAGILQRVGLARMFAYSSFLAALAVCGGHLVIIIAHFKFQSEILSICNKTLTGETIITGNPFWFGYTAHNLTSPEATSLCNSSFSHNSFTSIIWLLAAIVLSMLFCAVALAWSYQLQDPSYGRSRSQAAPSNQFRMNAFRPDGQRYDPPAGAPPGAPYEDRADAFVPPYDSNMPPLYNGGKGATTPPEKSSLYGGGGEWSASDTDLDHKPMHGDDLDQKDLV